MITQSSSTNDKRRLLRYSKLTLFIITFNFALRNIVLQMNS